MAEGLPGDARRLLEATASAYQDDVPADEPELLADQALRLIDTLWTAGRLGEATRLHHRCAERMRELGVPVRAMPLTSS